MTPARILIVEDDLIVASDIEQTVKRLGYDVVGRAVSGDEAIRKAKEFKPDLALMDIKIKGEIDGITTGALLKKELGLALIYLTAYSDPTTFERAKITEPYGYVIKPFNEIDLRLALGLALYKSKQEKAHLSAPPPVQHSLEPENENSSSPPLAAPESSKRKFNIAEYLKNIELFSELPAADREALAAACSYRAYKPKTRIISEGDESSSAFLVVFGRVAMLKTSDGGREIVVELVATGDLFNLTSAFEDNLSPLTARTQAQTSVIHIPKHELFVLLSKHPKFYQFFVRETSRRLKAAHNVMRALAHDKIEARVALTLTELSRRKELYDSDVGITISRQEIADLTGTSVESAIRVTKSFESQGLLEFPRHGVIKILNALELSELAAGS